MGADESVRVAQVRRTCADHLPGYTVRSVRLLGDGLEHSAYQVNDDLIVRVSKQPVAQECHRETRLLEFLAARTRIPIPVVVFTDADSGCTISHRLPGVPLLTVLPQCPAEGRTAIASELGQLLAELHGISRDDVPDVVDADQTPGPEWLEGARTTYLTVAELVPPVYRSQIEAFLQARPPETSTPLALAHNDLGAEHVLVDPRAWTVTGVIDWSDAALTDPACDFAQLYRDLGPDALAAALATYGSAADDAMFRPRAEFYARCGVIEDLAYGLMTDRPAYSQKSLSALPWLFAG